MNTASLVYKDVTSRYWQIALIGILLIGVLIRLYGINYGLPYLYDSDESTFVGNAIRMLANRDPNPHWFGHPGTTVIYLLAILYTLLFLVGRITGAFANAEAFKTLYLQDPTIFYLSGRLLIAAFGVATIFLIYKIGERLFDRTVGLTAAAFLALSPLYVLFSRVIRTDVLAGFFLLLALWFCLEITSRSSRASYLLAGLFTGLAVATKYPAVTFVPTIVLAYFISGGWRARAYLKLLAGGVSIVGGVFLGSPFLLLDFQRALQNVRTEARLSHLGATGEGFFPNLVWYLSHPFTDALTGAGLLLAGIGLVVCIASGRRERWLPVCYLVCFVLFICCLNLRWERWIATVVPIACLLLAGAVWYLADRLARINPQAGAPAGLVLVFALCIPLAAASIVQGRELSAHDTRTLARTWVLKHLKPGSRVLVESSTPQLPRQSFTFFKVDRDGTLISPNLTRTRAATLLPNGHIGEIKNLQDIRKQKIQYVVMGNIYDRYLEERDRYPQILKNYEAVMSAGTLIYEVERTPGVNLGPQIRVYQLF